MLDSLLSQKTETKLGAVESEIRSKPVSAVLCRLEDGAFRPATTIKSEFNDARADGRIALCALSHLITMQVKRKACGSSGTQDMSLCCCAFKRRLVSQSPRPLALGAANSGVSNCCLTKVPSASPPLDIPAGEFQEVRAVDRKIYTKVS
jgi:hypothetical protein